MPELNTKSPGAAYLTKDNIAIPPESEYPHEAHRQAAETVADSELLANEWPEATVAPAIRTLPTGPEPVVPDEPVVEDEDEPVEDAPVEDE